MNELINNAVEVYKATAGAAYRTYTTKAKKLIKSSYPLDNQEKFDKFNDEMKVLRARLSQGVGAASKNGKAVVLHHYIALISESSDLNFSVREAQEVLKMVAGRSVNKTELTGLFVRKQDKGQISPYFRKDKKGENVGAKYREAVFAHPLIVELKRAAELYDKEKPKMTNPYQAEITRALAKFKD